MPAAEQEAYHALCGYTLNHSDPAFIHQHVVDAWAAQHAGDTRNPIGIVFALAGLYLHAEKGFTGKQVQRVHRQLARRKLPWPPIVLPRDRGSLTALNVAAAPEGPERDRAIHEWCSSVWAAFAQNRDAIAAYLKERGVP